MENCEWCGTRLNRRVGRVYFAAGLAWCSYYCFALAERKWNAGFQGAVYTAGGNPEGPVGVQERLPGF